MNDAINTCILIQSHFSFKLEAYQSNINKSPTVFVC